MIVRKCFGDNQTIGFVFEKGTHSLPRGIQYNETSKSQTTRITYSDGNCTESGQCTFPSTKTWKLRLLLKVRGD